MMKKFRENILVKINGRPRVNLEKSVKEEKIEGEINLRIVENNDKTICLSLKSFCWCGLSLKTPKGSTGKISFMASPKKEILTPTKEASSFSITTTGKMAYKAIEEAMGVTWVSSHLSTVAPEHFEISITGKLKFSKRSKSTISDLAITMTYLEGGLNFIDTLTYADRKPSTFLLAGSTNLTNIANLGNCHPTLEINERTLTIQPVGFRVNAQDTSPTGQSLATQMAAASLVWGKCCVRFNVLPIVYVDNATLKTSANISNIRASYTSSNANAIEVFFVDNNLTAQGGGVANACNSLLGNVVMSDNNAGNPQLLAHELGHIIGLGHPGSSFAGCTEPDANTVMAPSGSPNNPNSTNNTHWNCVNVANPGLSTSTTTTCCLTHDTPNTVIKDYPEDTGAEPNPGFAGRNFYSMSNVWNRLTATPGGLNGDGTPSHQNPKRFEADGTTPHTNHLFAKVHVLENLRVRDAKVNFYLKHPGAGSGSTNVQFLGAAPITGTLTTSNPVSVSLPWNIPSGTPNHSCVFAVIDSPAEPAEDITTLNWQQTELLVRNDNDWAQRNLTIEQMFPNLGNEPSENIISFPPVIISYPKEAGLKKTTLDLELTIPSEKELINELELIIPSLDLSFPLANRKKKKVRIGESIKPGSQLLVMVRAKLNTKGFEFGESKGILGFTPVFGKTPIVGYEFAVNRGNYSQVIGQMTDRALAAIKDLGEFSGYPEACSLLAPLRKIHQQQCTSPRSIIRFFAEHIGHIETLMENLKRDHRKAFNFADLPYAFDKLRQRIEGDEGVAFDAIQDMVNRIIILNWYVYKGLEIAEQLDPENC